MAESLGYGDLTTSRPVVLAPDEEALASDYDVWLLDEGGIDFRNRSQSAVWPPALRGAGDSAPEWIVLKTAAPLAAGDLWNALANGQFLDQELPVGSLAERLIVVVSAADVRCEPARINRGLSWERTALDLSAAVRENPTLAAVAANCRYLAVRFGCEGAALVDCRGGAVRSVHLVFDPARLEDDWARSVEGEVVGWLTCFVAGIVSRLPEKRRTPSPRSDPAGSSAERTEIDSLIDGMKAGLTACRALLRQGHGAEKGVPALPLAEVAQRLLDLASPGARDLGLPCFEVRQVPDESSVAGGSWPWRILESAHAQRDGRAASAAGRARLLAQFGSGALAGVPLLRLGALQSVDRGEIESLRTIQSLIEAYREEKRPKRPLSIGVFGQPGSGKSFGVKEIARAVLGPDVPLLEFNLSQLNIQNEPALIGAFHQVRDKVLEGRTPVVFWDEFDSGQLQWLAKLLAPMQDGTFLEGQSSHPIGKCVFVFAGGTSYDFASFGPPENAGDASEEQRRRLAEERETFQRSKGPDFKSRLSAYLNVAGPNRRKIWDWKARAHRDDPSDTGFPLRRALLLRSQFGLKGDERLDIDSALLSALLETSVYRHGARSMEKLTNELRAASRGGRLRLSHLPPEEILDLHVDADDFLARLRRDLEFQTLAREIAPQIHAHYLERSAKPTSPERILRAFDALPVEVQEDNLAAARRIPEALAVAGLRLVKADDQSAIPVDRARQAVEASLEAMAETEQEGWMEHKYRNDWTYDKVREDKTKRHDCLLHFRDLSNDQKEKDRTQVRKYLDFAAAAGYGVAFIQQD
jgi:hypothetical protein